MGLSLAVDNLDDATRPDNGADHGEHAGSDLLRHLQDPLLSRGVGVFFGPDSGGVNDSESRRII